jgi:DNA-binding HxlR family transcriptional regulator
VPFDCPVVAALDVVSTRAAFLVLREALYGASKFEEFVARTGLSEAIAAARLRALVQQEVMRLEPYREEGQRTRQRYVLTEKGADLGPVLYSLAQWSMRWLGDGSDMGTHRDCGAGVQATLRCTAGHDVASDEVDLRPRPKWPPSS